VQGIVPVLSEYIQFDFPLRSTPVPFEMKPQVAILDPVPAHARHLFLDLNPSAHPRLHCTSLQQRVMVELWCWVSGRGRRCARCVIQGLRAFPELPTAKPSIPSTQHALWIWLRGDDPGDLLLRGHKLQALIDPEFTLVQAIDSFLHRDSRDLTATKMAPKIPRTPTPSKLRGSGQGNKH